MVRRIDRSLLEELSEAARRHPRRRKNLNFHPEDSHPGHRLLNAVAEDSYIPPHRHLCPTKDETLVCLQGRLGLVTFDEEGHVQGLEVAGPGESVLGFDIPHGTFHTVVALAPGTVFLEAKSGPYLPLTPAEQAPWAPLEGDEAAPGHLASLKDLFPQ